MNNLVAMATTYMVNCMGKMQEVKKKDTASPISIILITDGQIWYVCVGLHLFSWYPPLLPIKSKILHVHQLRGNYKLEHESYSKYVNVHVTIFTYYFFTLYIMFFLFFHIFIDRFIVYYIKAYSLE